MIINILDPGLSIVGGHHLEWDVRIASELAAQGHQVTVYSHASITPEARAAFRKPVALVPIFRNHAYLNPCQIDPVAGELLGFIDVAMALAEDLQGTAKADLWLWPSLFHAQLYACTLVRPNAAIAACIHSEPDFMYSQGASFWRYAFIKAGHAGLRLNLGVAGPVLQQEYQALFGKGARVHSLPAPTSGYPASAARTVLKRIGFFGFHRSEKGLQVIPELISVLLREGYEVLLHDSASVFDSGQIAGLTRIGYVPDLAAEVAKCDLIVLPYDAKAYRSMESGIVWDALASGVPVVVPGDTAPARRVLADCAGKIFHFLTVDSIHQAIVDAKMDYATIAAAAFQASRKWKQTQGVANLVQALTRDVNMREGDPN